MKKTIFKPKPGQIDFTHARFAPVINCVLYCNKKILIVERSRELNFYPGYWNGISGFLDDQKSLKQKVCEEIQEELGISKKHILKIEMGEIIHQEAPKYKKTWIVHPILVTVATDKIKLDWEARGYQWIDIKEVDNFKLLPGFKEVIEKVAKFLPV